VGIVYLPDAADGKKQGLDDYLAAGEGTVGDLETMAEDRLRETGAPAGTLLSEVERQAAAHAHQGRALLHRSQGDKTRSVRLTGHAMEALKDQRKRELKQRGSPPGPSGERTTSFSLLPSGRPLTWAT
jgi:hypothetical protein